MSRKKREKNAVEENVTIWRIHLYCLVKKERSILLVKKLQSMAVAMASLPWYRSSSICLPMPVEFRGHYSGAVFHARTQNVGVQ